MAKLTRCDNCNKEREDLKGWMNVLYHHDPDVPAGFAIYPGGESLDFCSQTCVVQFFEKRLK